jgi:hypothetical protein
MKTTLTNNFHNTHAGTELSHTALEHIQNTQPANWTQAERRTVNRLYNKLCGIAGCTCGGTFGERPAFLAK